MQLSRRDALIALSALGAGSAVVGSLRHHGVASPDDEEVMQMLEAAATAIYPAEVSVDESFISTYVIGRTASRPEYAAGQATALGKLNQASIRVAGSEFSALAIGERRRVFRELGVPSAHPNPNGTTEERVRYYIVNDLIYVLFSTPIGGELVGCENPPGFPGGREAYQRGPDE